MARKLFFIFTLLLFSNLLFSQTEKYEANFIDTPINEVIDVLEKNYGLLFSYRKDDLTDINISEQLSENDLSDFLNTLFKDNGFSYEIVDGNYIILKKENNIIVKEEQLFTYCGTVLDGETNSPLLAVTVYIENTKYGTVTNYDGYFETKAPATEVSQLTISYLGFETIKIPTLEVAGKDCQNFIMSFSENIIACPVIITEYLMDGIQLDNDNKTTRLNPNNIDALPGQAEPDVFSTLKFLPGISSPTGETSNLNVRGGTADQNLILWENIPIYHSAHYFGMISAFNPYIINEIKVYRGGFGAEYGGRISGVIDMSSDWNYRGDSQYGAGVNFLNSYVHGKTKFLKNKASFIFSARRSIADVWRSPTFENITRRNQQSQVFQNIDVYDLPPHISVSDDFIFSDIHLKSDIEVTKKDKFSGAFFYGKNEFRDLISDTKVNREQEDSIDLKNHGIHLSWKHDWSDVFSSEWSGVSTQFDQEYYFLINFLEGNQSDIFGRKNNSINEKQFNFSNQYIFQNGLGLNLGYHFYDYNVNYQIVNRTGQNISADEKRFYDSNVHAINAGIKTNNYDRYGIDASIRWSYFDLAEKNYLEPRLHLWAEPIQDLTFSANIGKYNQFLGQLTQLRGNQTAIETPIWVMTGGKGIPVLSATQVQLGGVFQKNKWLIDIQAYTKNIGGMTSLATGFDPTPGHILGESETRGIDILIKKRWKNLRSWVSYSLSKTTHTFEEFFDKEFLAPFDQRHQLAWVNLFEYNQFSFSIGMEIYSGTPYSIISDFQKMQDDNGMEIFRPIYQEYNGSTLSIQHRSDASVLYKIASQKNRKFKGSIGVSVSNLFNRKNLYARDYFIEKRPSTPPSIQYIDKANMGFTPNAVVKFEW